MNQWLCRAVGVVGRQGDNGAAYRRSPRRWFGASMAILLIAFAGLGGPARALSLGFTQVDWLDNSGGFTSLNSDWGVGNLSITSADAGLFAPAGPAGFVGYVNLATTGASGATNWAIQNMTVAFSSSSDLDDMGPFKVPFSLGPDTSTAHTSGLDFVLSVSAAPLLGAPGVGVLAGHQATGTEQWLFGGEQDPVNGSFGNTGEFAPPAALNFAGAAAGAAAANTLRGSISGPVANVPTVDEEKNGCAPGAAARSLKYLQQQTGINVPGTAQTVYDSLKSNTYMKTGLGAGGAGTLVSNFVSGKQNYTKDNGLPVTTTVTTNIIDVVNALNKKADVEMGVSWGAGKGGHCVMVTEVIVNRNAAGAVTGYQVKYIDDRVQGDGKASNVPGSISFDSAGNMTGAAAGGKLNSFRIQSVPEPSTLLLLSVGAVALGRRRRRAQTKA